MTDKKKDNKKGGGKSVKEEIKYIEENYTEGEKQQIRKGLNKKTAIEKEQLRQRELLEKDPELATRLALAHSIHGAKLRRQVGLPMNMGYDKVLSGMYGRKGYAGSDDVVFSNP